MGSVAVTSAQRRALERVELKSVSARDRGVGPAACAAVTLPGVDPMAATLRSIPRIIEAQSTLTRSSAPPESGMRSIRPPSFCEALDDGYPSEGQIIDRRYVVGELIAEGGVGRVYECHHRVLGKKLALKVIQPSRAMSQDGARRFVLEARAASMIGNKHIVDVLDYGEIPGGSAYLVMELLEGMPLSDVLRYEEPMPPERVIHIALQVTDALRAAHAVGILHRDIKPENIFLEDRAGEEFVKILDFGLAKLQSLEGIGPTVPGTTVGTPAYMSPEQVRGKPLDERSDVYSLGMVLFEMLSGHLPFQGGPTEIMRQQMHERIPQLRSLWPGLAVPAPLQRVVSRCLCKGPEARYRNMLELREALEEAAVGPLSLPCEGPVAIVRANQPPPPPPAAMGWRQRARRAAVGAFLFACLFAGILSQARQLESGEPSADTPTHAAGAAAHQVLPAAEPRRVELDRPTDPTRPPLGARSAPSRAEKAASPRGDRAGRQALGRKPSARRGASDGAAALAVPAAQPGGARQERAAPPRAGAAPASDLLTPESDGLLSPWPSR